LFKYEPVVLERRKGCKYSYWKSMNIHLEKRVLHIWFSLAWWYNIIYKLSLHCICYIFWCTTLYWSKRHTQQWWCV